MPGGRATLQRVESLHRRKGVSLTLHRDGVTPDITVYAKVFGAQLEELAGTLTDTVRRVKISNYAIASSAWPGPPRRGDTIGGYVIESVDSRAVGDIVVVHILEVAKAL